MLTQINYRFLFLFLLCFGTSFAQTSYTWNGSTNSDWNTASNWTPNGVPGNADQVTIGSTANDPVLSANSAVADFSITSATLTLNGNTLTTSNSASFSGSTITSGTINASGASIDFGTSTFNATISAACEDLFFHGSVFNQSIDISKTGGSADFSSGGNTFNASAAFTNNGSGVLVLGTSSGDVFNSAATFINNSGGFNPAYNSTGNQFNGLLTITNTASVDINFALGSSAISQFNENIVVNNTGSGYILIGANGLSSLASGKAISIGSSGFNSGGLELLNLTQQGTAPIALTLGTAANLYIANSSVINGNLTIGGAQLLYLQNSTFNGTVTASAGSVRATSNVFNGITTLSMNGTDLGNNGGNTFNARVILNNNGPGPYWFGVANPDVFNSDLTLNATGSGSLLVGKSSAGNLYNGNVMVNMSSSGGIWLNYETTGTGQGTNGTFNGNITVTSTSTGEFSIGRNGGVSVLSAGKTVNIGSGGFTGGDFRLANLTQMGSTAQQFTLTGTSNLLLESGTVFNGTVNFTAPAVYLDGTTFNAAAIINNTSSNVNVQCTGGNIFNAVTAITNNSDNRYILAASSADEFNSDVTFNNTSAGSIELGLLNPITNIFKGNVTANGGNITLGRGASTAGFTGTSLQTVYFSKPGYGLNVGYGNFESVSINNPQHVKMLSNVFVNHQIILNSGTLKTNSDTLILGDAASITGANSTNFIDGAITKIGNQSFTFPIGKGSNYQPLSISAPANSTDAFTAEYFNTAQSFGTAMDATISNLSTCEYWNLVRTNGTSNVSATLGWNSSTCNAPSASSDARVAEWDGSTWKDFGNTASTGNQTSGTVTSAGLTTYGPLALARAASSSAGHTYTWNGSASTAWNASSNWSPSGVPGLADTAVIGSTANHPALSANTTVAKMSVTSTTLTLNSNTLTCNGSIAFSGSTVTTGALITSGGKYGEFGTTQFDCSVSSSSEDIFIYGSTFNQASQFTKTGNNSTNSSGGNTFNAAVTYYQTGSGYSALAFGSPDIYNSTVTVNNTGSEQFYLVYASMGNQFNGDVYLNNSSTTTGEAIWIVRGSNSSASFGGDIYVSNASGGFGGIKIGYSNGDLTSSLTQASGKSVFIGTGGFATGYLAFSNFTTLGTTAVNLALTGSGTIEFDQGNVFNGSLTINSPDIFFNGSSFNDFCSFTKTGVNWDFCDGGNSFNNNVTFNQAGTGYWVFGRYAADNFAGDLRVNTSNSGPFILGYSNHNLIFNGTGNQSVSGTGGDLVAANLEVNKSSGSLLLNTNMQITDSLIFVNGKITVNDTNVLKLESGAKVGGASSTDFVIGKVRKTGNTAFTFPIGKGNDYQPLSISAPANSTDAFTAEYFNTAQNFGSSTDATISNLSTCEYWNLQGTSGTSNVSATLGWNSSTCNAPSTDSDARVAEWDGSTWKDFGNTASSGNQTNGTVTSASLTTYGPIALARAASSSAGHTYTWNGSTSTAWNTAANWTPNGIPASADTAIIPATATSAAISGNTSIARIIMNNSILTLNSQTLTVTSKSEFNSATVGAGTLNLSGILVDYENSTFNASVHSVTEDVFVVGSTFNQSLSFEKTGSLINDLSSGGNTFNGTVVITFSGGAYMSLAHSSPDIYNSTLTVNNTGSDGIYLCWNSTGNQFNGDVYLNNFPSTTNTAIWLGRGNGSGSFGGNIYLSNTSGTFGGTIIGNGAGFTQASGKSISIGSGGYTQGFLQLLNFTQLGSAANNIVFPAGSAAWIYIDGCNFGGALNLDSPYGIYQIHNSILNGTHITTSSLYGLSGSVFNDSTVISITLLGGGGTTHNTGGNTFNGPVVLTNNTNNTLSLAETTGDIYNASLKVNLTGTNNSDVILASGSSNNQFNGDVLLVNSVTAHNNVIYIGQTATSIASFKTNISATGKVIFGYGGGRTIIDGTATQNIGGVTFNKININKASGIIQLTAPVTFNDTLNLARAIIRSNTNTVTFTNTGVAAAASTNSFIDGPVVKYGNTAFTFPIGSTSGGGSDYQSLSISAPANATDAFTAQYFNTAQTLGNTTDTTISNLSTCEYWTLNRTAGSDNVSVTLGWNSNSCNIAANDSDMRVAYFDTTAHNWASLGGSNFTGNTSQGAVSTNGPATQYGALTLGQRRGLTARGYIWNGSINSDWGTAANWTPNGVPTAYDNVTIVSATNQPVYNGVSGGVNDFTMQSGSIDLAGDTFNISGAVILAGGSVNDGLLNTTHSVSVTGSVTLNAQAVISGNLNLVQGILTSNSLLTLTNTAAVTGASYGSFVSGGILKIGNSAFTFPLGKGTDYKPISISAPSNPTDSFAAEYFNTGQIKGLAADSSVTNISNCEYWYLNRINGTSTVEVSLSWDSLSCNVSPNLNKMVLVGWNDSIWKNLGATNITGTSARGQLTSSTLVNTFGPFTLANQNPCNMILSVNSDTIICKGDSAHLSASGGASYTWAPNAGLISAATSTPIAMPSVTTTYTVTVTSSSGCSQTQTTTVFVRSRPTVGARASSNTVCVGNNVVLKGTGALFYSWTNNVLDSIAFKPAQTSVYIVTGIDSIGCTDTAAISVTILPLPTVTASSTTTAVCRGNSLTLSGGGAENYTWTGNVIDSNPFTPSVTNTYTVTGTDANGCQNTSAISVPVYSNPFVTIQASAGAICPGASATLTATGAQSYNWSNAISNAMPFSPSSTATYTVTGTDSYGCTGTSTATITVNSAPNAQAGTAATICSGSNISLTASGGNNYLWSPANGLNNNTLQNPTAAPQTTTTYTVTVSNGSCSSTSTVTITVNASPQAGITVSPQYTITNANPNTIYVGSGAQSLTLTGNPGANAVSYGWSPNTALSCTNCLTTQASPTTTTIYTFTVTYANGCTAVSTVTITVTNLLNVCKKC